MRSPECRPAARLAVAVPAGVARLLLPRAVPRTVELQGQAHVTVGQLGHGEQGSSGSSAACSSGSGSPPDASRPPGHGEVHRRVGLEFAGRRVAPPPGSRGHRLAVQVGRGLMGEDGILASAQERGEVTGREAVPGLEQTQSGQVRGQQDGGPVGRQRSHDARHAPIGRRRRGTWGALATAGGRRAGRAPLCRSRRPAPRAAVAPGPPGRAGGRVRRVSSRAAPRSVRRSGRRGGGPRPRPWWSCGGTAGSARRKDPRPSRSAPPRRPAARSRACPR